MLINLDDKLSKANLAGKEHRLDINKIYRQVAEVNVKLDRESKLRELVDMLKGRIVGMVSEQLKLV